MAINVPPFGGPNPARKIQRLDERVTALEGGLPNNPLVVDVWTIDDFPAAVGDVITLAPLVHYILRAPITLPTNTRFEGINITITGDRTFATELMSDTATALFTVSGLGFLQLFDILIANDSGPLLDCSLGGIKGLSILNMNQVIFTGDRPTPPAPPPGTGTGEIGTVNGADRVVINACGFIGIVDGLTLDGAISEVSINSCGIAARAGSPGATFVSSAATANIDIFSLDLCRFETEDAADRCVNFSPSATYGSSIRLRSCSIRGPGTFVDAASLQKSDVYLVVSDNEGTTAPADSTFSANATYTGNTDETVITSAGATNEVPIGTGTPAHPVFNGGAFVERFALEGAEAQLQRFRCLALRSRTYRITVNCEVDRVGGGTQELQIAIQKNDVTHVPSRFAFSIANADKVVSTSAVIELTTNDTVRPVVANVTGTNNMIVKICQWSVEVVG